MTTAPPSLENQLQHDRMARAQYALLNGDMQVMDLTDCTWLVASKSSRYTVSLEEDAWACTCPDFAGRCQRFGLRCKHIEAVRLTEAEKIAESGQSSQSTHPQFSTFHTEEPMTQSMPSHDSPTLDLYNEQILWRLRQSLDRNRVKRRQAPGQGTAPYLEGYDVIEAANDLFLFRWSFDLLSEPHIMRWDKVITFYDQRARKKVPVLGEDGKPTTEIAGMAYITGRVTVELDGKAYSHADVGCCNFNGDTPEALSTAIAGSVTDCIKRCFRQLGELIGHSTCEKEAAESAGLENGALNGKRSNSNVQSQSLHGQATSASASASQTEVLLYGNGEAVHTTNTAELEAYNIFKSAHQGLAPASREVLRAWVASHNGKK